MTRDANLLKTDCFYASFFSVSRCIIMQRRYSIAYNCLAKGTIDSSNPRNDTPNSLCALEESHE